MHTTHDTDTNTDTSTNTQHKHRHRHRHRQRHNIHTHTTAPHADKHKHRYRPCVSGVHRDTSMYPSVPRCTPGYPWVCTLGYPDLHRTAIGYPEGYGGEPLVYVHRGTPVHRATLVYTGVPRGTPVCTGPPGARITQGFVSVCVYLKASTWQDPFPTHLNYRFFDSIQGCKIVAVAELIAYMHVQGLRLAPSGPLCLCFGPMLCTHTEHTFLMSLQDAPEFATRCFIDPASAEPDSLVKAEFKD
jgi:hypothetical protein